MAMTGFVNRIRFYTVAIGITMTFTRAYAATAQYFTVNETDMQNAVCKTKLPISDRYIENWIAEKSLHSVKVKWANVAGYQFQDESEFLIRLFQKLQVNEKPSLIIDLTKFKKPLMNCVNVRCAAAQLYGPRESLRLLYLLGEFGYNANYLADPKSRPFTIDELDTLTKSFSDVPLFLRNLKSDFTISILDQEGPMGNSVIQLFKPWTQVEEWKKNYVLYHEVSHDLAQLWGHPDKDGSWIGLSGWKHSTTSTSFDVLEPKNYVRQDQPCLSEYACTNAVEYFAEAFSSFRYSPQLLLKTHPQIFYYIKKYYQGTAYDRADHCKEAHPEYRQQLETFEHLFQDLQTSLKKLVANRPHLLEQINKACYLKVTKGEIIPFKQAKQIEDKTNTCLDFEVLSQVNIQSDEYTSSQLVTGLQPALRLKELSGMAN